MVISSLFASVIVMISSLCHWLLVVVVISSLFVSLRLMISSLCHLMLVVVVIGSLCVLVILSMSLAAGGGDQLPVSW
jgi:hypothetical protein